VACRHPVISAGGNVYTVMGCGSLRPCSNPPELVRTWDIPANTEADSPSASLRGMTKRKAKTDGAVWSNSWKLT
jgi:hypothetical protein